jgi:ribosomal protein S18 acetylase RimI-like enzyme
MRRSAIVSIVEGRAADFPIRHAVPSDAATLAAFGARTFTETFGPHNTADDLAEYLARAYGIAQQKREIEDPNVITLLAENAEQLIAYAQLRITPPSVEIARFYVDRPWQGRGVAHQMMRAAFDAASSAGADRIWLAVWERNPRAIAFYEKCGFRDIGSQPFILGSDLQTDRVMEASLRGAP